MKKALLVIDVQNEYFTGKLPVTYPDPEESLSNIVSLMRHARSRKIPVIVIRHTSAGGDTFLRGTPGWELHPLIKGVPYDHCIEKTKPSSFWHTQLEEILRNGSVTGVTIAGYMTQMCCDTTARDASHRGYEVEFLSDATGTIDIRNDIGEISGKELHHAALMAQSIGFSRILSSAQWLSEN